MSIDLATATQLHIALTATGDALLTILQNSSTEVVQTALRNPALAENHLLALLQRNDLSSELIKSICKTTLAESSHKITFAIAKNPATPAQQLVALLPHLYLFELLTICSQPQILPDQKLAAERAIIQRLPVTPLGNRLTLARRATPLILEAMLKEGDQRLVEICLSNPRLKEGAVFQLLRSGTATAETISLVARHPRWQSRPNIREAVLTNPKTPLIWFTLWLPAMKIAELKRLLTSQRLTAAQKKTVEARLVKSGVKAEG